MESQALDTHFVDAHWATLWPAAAAMATGAEALVAPMAGRLVQQGAVAGETLRAGAELAVLESMKMEHLLVAGAREPAYGEPPRRCRHRSGQRAGPGSGPRTWS